jgi:hypothetical protein
MTAKVSVRNARLALATLAALILAAAFAVYRYYPVSVLSGENSVGTWVSGFLLAACAALCLAVAMRRGPLPWLLFMVFFTGLALDERFMFHEQLKEYILFSAAPPQPGVSTFRAYAGELPVILAALLGAVVAFLIWRKAKPRNRAFLFLASVLGSLSVSLDVIRCQMVLEDLSKVLGELCITFCLLGEVEDA